MCVHTHELSYDQLFATLWTVACQDAMSMEFPRQEYWGRLPFPPPGYLPNSGIEPSLLHLLHWQAGSLPAERPGNPYIYVCVCVRARVCACVCVCINKYIVN